MKIKALVLPLIIVSLFSFPEAYAENKPRLTIIVSLSEHLELLTILLEDLRSQTIFEQSQIILVGPEKCILSAPYLSTYTREYANIRYLTLANNSKWYEQINAAIRYAKADFLIQVHPGDTREADSLEKRLNLLEADPSLDLVYCDYWWAYTPNQRAKNCGLSDVARMPEFDPALFGISLPGPEPMWRKSMHERYEFFTDEFTHCSAWAFWRKAVAQGSLFKKAGNTHSVHYIDLDEAKQASYMLRLVQIIQEEQDIIKKYPLSLIKNSGPEKPMVVIVPSYNNWFWHTRNLNSICTQNYSNYRVIYINDASSDETAKLVSEYIAKNKLEERITFIDNKERKGCPLANIYYALSLCKPEEIAVVVDGDDWFPHENVLAHLNRVYQDPDVWMTYGQFAIFPYDTIGWAHQVPEQIIQENGFRGYHWCTTHLRSFYVSLFNATAYSDYMYEGRFFPMAGDLALMFPLLELAATHSRFIPEVLYIYNRANALNEDKVNKELQKSCEMAARAHHRYNSLESL